MSDNDRERLREALLLYFMEYSIRYRTREKDWVIDGTAEGKIPRFILEVAIFSAINRKIRKVYESEQKNGDFKYSLYLL